MQFHGSSQTEAFLTSCSHWILSLLLVCVCSGSGLISGLGEGLL